jgi:hypothetical protein
LKIKSTNSSSDKPGQLIQTSTITHSDLVVWGVNMEHINKYKQEPLVAKTEEGLHINPLEFLAAIINL